MGKQRLWIVLMYCIFAGAGFAAGQTRKPGLWQVAKTTRIQGAGETPGNFSGGAQSSPPDSGLPVCLTQEMINKYGVILPPSLRDCELSNVKQTANTFKADMTCKGGYNGVGSVESTWTDDDHVVGKVRFVAKTKESGADARALRWMQESTAVFKGSDCGNVQPRKVPEKTPEK